MPYQVFYKFDMPYLVFFVNDQLACLFLVFCVEEYNQLKERSDDKDQELLKAHTEVRQKSHELEKARAEFDDQLSEMEREFTHERDDLENHLEEVKQQLQTLQVSWALCLALAAAVLHRRAPLQTEKNVAEL